MLLYGGWFRLGWFELVLGEFVYIILNGIEWGEFGLVWLSLVWMKAGGGGLIGVELDWFEIGWVGLRWFGFGWISLN